MTPKKVKNNIYLCTIITKIINSKSTKRMFFFVFIFGMFFYIIKLMFQCLILIVQFIFGVIGLIFDCDWFGSDYS